KQKQHSPMSIEEQVLLMYIFSNLYSQLSKVQVSNINRFECDLINYFQTVHPGVLKKLSGDMNDDIKDDIVGIVSDFVTQFNCV
ncbi:MAG: F0F1 ATP synthase subunit alpha, partial [Wolbachia pipientis]